MTSHLKKFQEFLVSFGGGGLSHQQATKHMDQASYMVRERTSRIDSPSFVIDVAAVIDRNLKKKWQPNTLRTYLNSLRQFVDFLEQMTVLEIEDFEYNTTVLRALNQQCLKWLRSATKEEKKNKSTKNKTEEENINPQDFQAYMTSERAKTARKLLSSPDRMVTMTNHTLCRNYLLMCVALTNCQRTGCLLNLTVEEFVEGQNYIKRGKHILEVRNHKTAGKYGPANMVLSTELYIQIQTYIAVYRPRSSPNTRQLFLNWSGSPMDSATVIHALSTELSHAGVEKRLNCTSIRHLAVTLLSGVLTESDLGDLSGLMTHSRAMAESTYNDSMKGARMARISTIANKILTKQDLCPEDLVTAIHGENR